MKRVIAALTALVLAVAGGAVLLSYVARADQRALAGMETTSVLVVDALVPKGTAADQLGKSVQSKELPALAVAPGAVASANELAGKVASADLQPGEQVLTGRFVDPATLANADEVTIPSGLQQISVVLESQRVVGGRLVPGSSVGIFISVPEKDKRPNKTHLVLPKTLVTRVDGGAAPAATTEGNESGDQEKQVPEGSVLVTFALSAPDAEKVIFAAEFGTLWLSLEPVDAKSGGTTVVTERNVYK